MCLGDVVDYVRRKGNYSVEILEDYSGIREFQVNVKNINTGKWAGDLADIDILESDREFENLLDKIIRKFP